MKYKVIFNIAPDEKIPAIKLYRLLTGNSFKESRDFIEAHIMPQIDFTNSITFILTEQQLGKYLICRTLEKSRVCDTTSIEEYPGFICVDLT